MNLKNPPRVLLASPTSEHKLYCQAEWIDLLRSLTYPNLKFIIIDNSDTQLNFHRLKSLTASDKRFSIIYKKFDKSTSVLERIARCQEIFRKYCLNLKYDYLFSLESDVFSPVNIIEWLVNLDKPLVGCAYFHFQREETAMLLHEITTFDDGKQETHTLSFRKQFEFFDGTVKKAVQPGIGCMLMRADVLEKVQFRLITDIPEYKDLPMAGYPSDYVFYEDLRHNYNIFPYIDTSIIPVHVNSNDRWQKLKENGLA
jgi:hypothetical protein